VQHGVRFTTTTTVVVVKVYVQDLINILVLTATASRWGRGLKPCLDECYKKVFEKISDGFGGQWSFPATPKAGV